MKAFKYIFFLLLIFVIGLAIYIAVQPNSLKVTRSKTLQASNQLVYNTVIDFKNWESFSSWKEAKPNTVFTLSEKIKAWTKTMDFGISNDKFAITENGKMLEVYLTDTDNNPNPVDWVTELYIEVIPNESVID